jgi:diaminopimelate decarboxylase
MNIKEDHRIHLEKVIKRLDSSFFYYDLDGLQEHLLNLSSLMKEDPDFLLWYACKANPMSAVLKIFRNNGFGIDVASKGEIDQVLRSGIRPQNILSTGPSKSKKYLKELLEEEINIVVCESLNQAYWLDQIASKMGKRPLVLLRVQMEWEGGESVLGGNSITPFGEDEQTWLKLDKKKVQNLDIQGLHVFQWGNILDTQRLGDIWEKIAERSFSLAEKLGIQTNILDLGGGIGIPYTKEQKEVDFNEVLQILKKLKTKFGWQKIWMELGRYAVGPYGHYMTQVIDRKNVRGTELLILDGGVNHIVRPAITGEPFPVELFRKSTAEAKSFQIHGPLCTALDNLGTLHLPEDTAPGDWLCFHQAGAYGFTEAMPFFLCHNLPAEVIMYDGNLMIPRTPRKAEEWLV